MQYENKNVEIKMWEVFDVIADPEWICNSLTKKGNICNKKATYINLDNTITCKIHSCKNEKIKKVTKKKVKSYSLHNIIKKIVVKMNEIKDIYRHIFDDLDIILIELQPKCNSKMSLVSHSVFTKLVEFTILTDCKIKFVQASRKLKNHWIKDIEESCKLKKGYSRRKKLSINYTKHFLEKSFDRKWIDFLGGNKKMDDLSDSFLMCYNEVFRC
ncbi:MAG TPA: hypothetical protein V6C58_26650 [Allocoleopsis sp.]